MASASFVAIPQETEPQLKRSLDRIVEEVDIIIGNRDSDRTTLVTLDARTTALEEASGTTDTTTDTTETSTTYAELGGEFEDFDSPAWAGLSTEGVFSADGADLVNAPFTATGGTTYIIYVQSGQVSTDGVNQKITVQEIGTDLLVYIRSGLTFDTATTEGWTQL